MHKDQFCSALDRRELPGDAGPCPMRRALPGNPAHFLVLIQFGNLKLKDTRPPPGKAKFSKKAYLWPDTQIVGPPANDFVLPGQGTIDALWVSFYDTFFSNSWHRCSFLFQMVRLVFLRIAASSCTFSLSKIGGGESTNA